MRVPAGVGGPQQFRSGGVAAVSALCSVGADRRGQRGYTAGKAHPVERSTAGAPPEEGAGLNFVEDVGLREEVGESRVYCWPLCVPTLPCQGPLPSNGLHLVEIPFSQLSNGDRRCTSLRSHWIRPELPSSQAQGSKVGPRTGTRAWAVPSSGSHPTSVTSLRAPPRHRVQNS